MTQAQFDSGLPIVATFTATAPSPVRWSASVSTSVRNNYSGLTLQKSASTSAVKQADTFITYTYTVGNGGTTPISGVVVTDDNGTPGILTDDFAPATLLGLDNVHNIGDINADGKLDPTETWTFRATHTVTAAEFAAGKPLVNTATVTGASGILDGETFLIGDRSPFTASDPSTITFEFDKDGHVAAGHYAVPYTGLESASGIDQLMVKAINQAAASRGCTSPPARRRQPCRPCR